MIRDLRQQKLIKEIFLRSLLEKCSSDRRSSQFAMVISSLKTSNFRAENCLDHLLEYNNYCFYSSAIVNPIGM